MKQFIVMVAPGNSVVEVAKAVQACGFEVESVLEEIGQIVGAASVETKKTLEKVLGVESISEAHSDFNIGPPDSALS